MLFTGLHRCGGVESGSTNTLNRRRREWHV